MAPWIETRRPAPPSGVVEHLRKAYPGAAPPDQASREHDPNPRTLAQAALDLLGRVTAQPAGGRELARDLLAADALLTYAFEIQAERDVEGLTGLADFVARERRQDGV